MKHTRPLHNIKELWLFLFAVVVSATILCIAFAGSAGASGINDDFEEPYFSNFLHENEDEQAVLFADLAMSRMKYITSRSLCGKKGEWLAFVDFYEEYQDGMPLNSYLLQRGTLQYGLQPLPENAKTSTLYVGNSTFYSKAEKQSMFTYRTAPPLSMPLTAEGDDVRMSVTTGRQTTTIQLQQRYPQRDFEDVQVVLEQMAPAYANYIQRRDGSFDHAFLRLRSYVTDAESLGRVYSWELTLVAEDTLPSKGIVIRYDCDTGQVAGAVNREIRSYFG